MMNYNASPMSVAAKSCLPVMKGMMDQKLSVLIIKAILPAGEITCPATLADISSAFDDDAEPDLQAFSVEGVDEAVAFLRQRQVDAILLDQGADDGMAWLHSFAAELPILIIAGDDGIDAARRAIHAGADDVLLPADLTKESFRRRIELAIARKATEGRRLRYAREDQQTGLANSPLLEERFIRALARSDRFATLVGLVAIDLDGFDGVIARHDQNTADHLLTLVGQRLQGETRQTDTLARTRDHGFTWLVEGLSAIDDINALVSRLPDRLAEPFSVMEQNLRITASVGVAVCPFHGRDFQSVHSMAEAAMMDVSSISGDALLMPPLPTRSAAFT